MSAAPAKPKGVVPKKSLVAKLATPDTILAYKAPAPSSPLEAVSQSFAGTPSPTVAKPKRVIVNPLIKPKTAYPAPPPEDIGASLPAPPIARKKKLRFAVEPTPDYTPKTLGIPKETQDMLDAGLPAELKEYQLAQTKIESTNPYLTDTVIYTPQTRKSFYRFIADNYSDSFKLLPQIKGRIDEDACAKLGAAAGTAVEAFLYQKFVREYIRNAAPYRGILVYHGLGSGKTCSSIAAAEALYGTANKKIIVMTPASLKGNFMSEISFCGFRHFNTQNHWISQPLVSDDKVKDSLAQLYAVSVLSLSIQFINTIKRRPESERRVIWVPDFTKPANYTSLSQQERDDIRAQITNMIESRVTFINYNGIPAAELKKYACQEDPVTGQRFFDNAVIVIDEIHNLTRLMQGEIMPYIVKRKGRARKIPVEPITPGKWKPGLCGATLNYKRAYLFYKLLTDARNSKIIGLSGTPIINFPEEVGILANILGGYIECVKVAIMSSDKSIMEKFKQIAEEDPRVDIVRFRAGDRKMDVLISVFNEGYERVIDKENPTDFVGVRYNPDAQDGIRTVFERIKKRLADASIPIGTEEYVSYPRLPIDEESFRKEFVNPVDLSITNELVLQKRLTGLISYYKGSKVEYMPRVAKDEIVKCEMSDYVLSKYTTERIREISGEAKKDKEKGDAFADVEVYARMKNPSSYRFRSRALCNFAFPKSIVRPFPDSEIEEEEETTVVEDLEMAEAQSDVYEDLAAEEEVARENASIPDPDVEEATATAAEDAEDTESEADNASSVGSSILSSILSESNEEESNNESSLDSNTSSVKSDLTENESNSEGEEDKEQVEALERFKRLIASKKGGFQEGGVTEGESEKTATATAPAPAPRPLRRRPKVIVETPSEGVAETKEDTILDTITSAAATAASTIADTVTTAASAAADTATAAVSTVTDAAKTATATVASAAADSIRTVRRRRPVPIIEETPEPTPENVASEAGAEYEAEQEAVVARTLTYQERIKRAMDKLDADRDKFLKLDSHIPESRLAEYSTKLDHMLRRILASKGSNLVYSQFKTVEGLGVLGVVLKANGFTEIRIDGGDAAPYFSEETEASLRKGPSSGEKRFISFTGEGSRDRRNLILNVFNGNFDKLPPTMRTVLEESGFSARKNMYGELCWVIGITGAGAEGISLKCCRSVHIMEPYWNNVRLDQVKGRAIRICSHQDLPFKDRDVEIYTYYTVFSTDQKNYNKIDMTIRTTDENETSDEKVFNVSIKKDKVNQGLLQLMKEAAVDCGLNSADNEDVSCFMVEGRPDQYLFDPDLEVDKILTNIELKRVETTKATVTAPETSILKEVGAKARPKADIIQVKVIKFRGVEYYIMDKPGSGGMMKSLYAMSDTEFKRPLGEIPINPADGTLKGSKPIFYTATM